MNYIYGIILIIVLFISGYCYKLYNDNQILKLNQAQLEKSIDEQYQVILKNKKDFEEKETINKNLNLLVQTQEDRIGSLRTIFNKEKK